MKFAYRWHGKLGAILAVLLAISSLSGVALLWLQPLPTQADESPAVLEWSQALDHGLPEVAARFATSDVDLVDLPRQAGDPIRVHLRSVNDAQTGWMTIDVPQGRAGPLQRDSHDVRVRLLELHEHLLQQDVGPWILRIIALAAMVLVGMGIRIWWRLRKLPVRSPWRRWHRRIGAAAALPLLMMLTTGFVLRSPEVARSALAAVSHAPPTAPTGVQPASSPASGQQATLGQVLVAAAVLMPSGRPMRIYGARDGVVRVRMRSDEWNPYGMESVYLRANDASLLRIARWSDLPLAQRYLNVVFPLHTGWLPGQPSMTTALGARGLWTLFGLALAGLAVSGAWPRFRAAAQSKARPR